MVPYRVYLRTSKYLSGEWSDGAGESGMRSSCGPSRTSCTRSRARPTGKEAHVRVLVTGVIRVLVSGIRVLVTGIRVLVSGIRVLVSGIRVLVTGCTGYRYDKGTGYRRVLVTGVRVLVTGTRVLYCMLSLARRSHPHTEVHARECVYAGDYVHVLRFARQGGRAGGRGE